MVNTFSTPPLLPYTFIPPLNKDWLTPIYDVSCALVGLGRGFKQKVLHTVVIPDNATVVDVGCGTGVFADVALATYPAIRVIGIDPDKRALTIAKRRCARWSERCELHKAFAEQLPLLDASADAVFSTLVFHHLPDAVKRAAVFEMRRILKPGGHIVIADFGSTTSAWVRWILRRFEHLEYLAGNLNGQIPRDMADAGFSNIRIAATHFPGVAVTIGERAS